MSASISVQTPPAKLSRGLRTKLYINRALEAWADRCWQFAVGLYLIKLYEGSLLLSAVYGILSSVAVIVALPVIGRWVHQSERLPAAKLALLFQNSSISLSAFFAAIYFARATIGLDDKVAQVICPIGLIAFAASGKVWFNGYSVVLEHDWLLAIVGNDQELTELNAFLRRIDLATKLVAPAFVGFLTQYSPVSSSIFLAVWVIISAFIERQLIVSIFKNGPESLRSLKNNVSSDAEESLAKTFSCDTSALREYFRTFALPGLSYALLYLTVLGLDSITTGYLLSVGLTEGIVGVVSLLCGLTGLVATVLFPPLVKCFGLKVTGLVGYVIQTTFLLLCLLEIAPVTSALHTIKFFGTYELSHFLFLAGLILSRIGLWLADLSANQLIQYTDSPAIVSGVQRSANTTMELIKFALVAAFPAIKDFWILSVGSVGAIALATLLSVVYTLRKDLKKQ